LCRTAERLIAALIGSGMKMLVFFSPILFAFLRLPSSLQDLSSLNVGRAEGSPAPVPIAFRPFVPLSPSSPPFNRLMAV